MIEYVNLMKPCNSTCIKNISSRVSADSEAKASELADALEEMCPRCL